MQPDASLEILSDFTILTVPGLDGSGPDHWQSRWEFRFSNCRRVNMGDWANPVRAYWVNQLDRALRLAGRPVLIAAHSLGCIAVASWVTERWSLAFHDIVAGALLVAPPNVESAEASSRMATFKPIPREPLPFPTLLLASHNDPFASFDTSARIAQMWGSELVDAGYAGHINADSGLQEWPEGIRLLNSLGERANRRFDSGVWPFRRRDREANSPGLALSDPV
jgi:uncharacterized protein